MDPEQKIEAARELDVMDRLADDGDVRDYIADMFSNGDPDEALELADEIGINIDELDL